MMPALDRSLDEEQQNLARWGQESIKEGNLKHIIDSGIKGEISQKCLKKFVQVVEIRLRGNPKQRPTMAEVVVTLESVMTIQEKINRSLQDAGKTIFGRMLGMFIFSSNANNPGISIKLLDFIKMFLFIPSLENINYNIRISYTHVVY